VATGCDRVIEQQQMRDFDWITQAKGKGFVVESHKRRGFPGKVG
jgi:hypothetical protein